MSFSNLLRIKEKLELSVPSLVDRTDYDERVRRLMGIVHQKVRMKIVDLHGGTMPVFVELMAPTAVTSPMTLASTLTKSPRRVRFRLSGADGFATDPMAVFMTGTVDGIDTDETLLFTGNEEVISKTAWDSIDTGLTISDIPSTAGELQALEDVDPVLSDIEDLFVACMFLTEAVDRFDKEANPAEVEPWCQKAKSLLAAWIEANLKEDVLDHPLGLRAES